MRPPTDRAPRKRTDEEKEAIVRDCLPASLRACLKLLRSLKALGQSPAAPRFPFQDSPQIPPCLLPSGGLESKAWLRPRSGPAQQSQAGPHMPRPTTPHSPTDSSGLAPFKPGGEQSLWGHIPPIITVALSSPEHTNSSVPWPAHLTLY